MGGMVDVGNDLGGIPQGIGRYRPQADGPVAALAGAGHADNVELHAAAERMPLQRAGDPGPDLVEGCGRFCKECLHVASPLSAVSGAAPPGRGEGPPTRLLGRGLFKAAPKPGFWPTFVICTRGAPPPGESYRPLRV